MSEKEIKSEMAKGGESAKAAVRDLTTRKPEKRDAPKSKTIGDMQTKKLC